MRQVNPLTYCQQLASTPRAAPPKTRFFKSMTDLLPFSTGRLGQADGRQQPLPVERSPRPLFGVRWIENRAQDGSSRGSARLWTGGRRAPGGGRGRARNPFVGGAPHLP